VVSDDAKKYLRMSFSTNFEHFAKVFKRRRMFRFGAAYVVVAWVILQLAEITFPAFDIPDSTMRLLVVGAIVGFPLVLSLAWLLERGDPDSERSRWLEFVFLGSVAVGCLGIAWLLPGPGKYDAATAVSKRSIAVMPFLNMSDDSSNDYFSDGVSEELLNVLAKIDGLKVAARTSSFAYRGQAMDVRAIARELGVATILEGSVRKHLNTVRVTAQLIDASDGTHLWSQTYDRVLTDVFAIQDEIATAIVDALKGKLLDTELEVIAERSTNDIDAYDLYLLGRHHSYLRTAEDIDLAAEYFARAVAWDSGYVPAYTGLADAYLLQVSYSNKTNAEALPLAEVAALQALDLDPGLSEAHASLGLVREQQNRWDEAKASYLRAIDLDPDNAMAHLWYGNVLAETEQHDESLVQYQLAFALEPMSKPINNNLSWGFFKRGRFPEARQHFDRLTRLDEPNLGFWTRMVGMSYASEGKLAEAVQGLRESLAISPDNEDALSDLATIYLSLGDLDEARHWASLASELDPLDGDTMNAEINVRVAARNFDQVVPYIEEKFAIEQSRDNSFFIALMGMISLMQGNQEAAKVYFDEYLEIYDGKVHTNSKNYWSSLSVSYFLLNHGEAHQNELARSALAEIRENLQEVFDSGFVTPDIYYALAQMEAIDGRQDESLAALQQAFESGWRAPWLARVDPLLAMVRDNPGFFLLMQKLDETIQAEVNKLKDLSLAAYTPPARWVPVAVSESVLAHYLGYYRNSNNDMPSRFFIENSMLHFQQGDGKALRLSALSDTEFFSPLYRDRFQFVMDEAGKVTHFIAHAAGGQRRAKRINYEPPERVVIDPALLADYAGLYEIDGDLVSVTADDEGLLVSEEGNRRRRMWPTTDSDFFFDTSLVTVSFPRHANGSVNSVIVHKDGVDIEGMRVEPESK
jgi:TolB-like protein/Tfp pilus assembly protein PilF